MGGERYESGRMDKAAALAITSPPARPSERPVFDLFATGPGR